MRKETPRQWGNNRGCLMPMASADQEKWLNKLSAFRAELADVAYAMDLRGRAEAADVALMAFARIGEICAELQPTEPDLPRGLEPDGIKE